MIENIGNVLPDFNPSEVDTDAGFYKALKLLWDRADETCIQAIVEEYDSENKMVTVSPLPVRVYDTVNGEIEHKLASITIPVLHFCHGGFEIESHLFKGDTGYIIAADRQCYSIQEKSGKVISTDKSDKEIDELHGRPDTFATKKYAWGFFLPCSWATRNEDFGKDLVVKKIGKLGEVPYIRFCENGSLELGAFGYKFLIDKDGPMFDSLIRVGKNIFINSKDIPSDKTVKFRDITILTGFKGRTKDNKVVLSARKVKVLSTEGDDSEDVEFEAGTGGDAKQSEPLTIEFKEGDEKIASAIYDGTKSISMTITNRRLIAGNNIEITENSTTKDLTINAIVPKGIEGYSQFDVVTNVRYSNQTHKFIQTKVTLDFVNGLLSAVSTPFNEEVFTAVEEYNG